MAEILFSPSRANIDPPLFTIQIPNLTIFIAASDKGLPPGFSNIRLRRGDRVSVWHARRLADHEEAFIARSFAPWLDEMDRIFG